MMKSITIKDVDGRILFQIKQNKYGKIVGKIATNFASLHTIDIRDDENKKVYLIDTGRS